MIRTQDIQTILELMELIRGLKVENKIRILGHIPKEDQISLMKNALGVVQPTLFEGGPGGGSASEAISLGVPVIASDIPINREMNCGKVTFFSAGNSSKLADVMLERGHDPYLRQDNASLLSEGMVRRKKAGRALKDIFNQAIEENAK
jgi:glycosyltransferase involved in cell wall biosynthesis